MHRALNCLAATIGVLTRTLSSTAPQIVPVEQEPRHHVVFSNEEVQVLDVVLPALTTTLFHTHQHDLAGLTLSADSTREEILGQVPTLSPPDSEGVAWFEAIKTPLTHRVTNVGTRPVHYVVFQLLTRPSARVAGSTRDSTSQETIVIDNERVRVVRIELAPGEILSPHLHSSAFGLVAETSGRFMETAQTELVVTAPGFVGWRLPDREHGIRNVGSSSLVIFEFEIF